MVENLKQSVSEFTMKGYVRMSAYLKSTVREMKRERVRVGGKTSRKSSTKKESYSTRESVVIMTVQGSDTTFQLAEKDWKEPVGAGDLLSRKALDSTISRRAAFKESLNVRKSGKKKIQKVYFIF